MTNFTSQIEAITGAITTPRLVLACATIYFLAFGPSLSRLLGWSKTTFYHGRQPLKLKLKDGTTTTLDRFCKSAIPPCRLNPLLFNGDLQTIWTAVVTTSVDIYYKRVVLEQDDPAFAGTYTIDFAVKPYQAQADGKLPPRTTRYTESEFREFGSNDSRPMLVTLHGLSGGSHELYLRELLAKLVHDDGGWEACVVNSRGCAEAEITSNVLYNARTTWDVRHAVKWLRRKFPNRPLFGCGFSLGGNIITNYIGEEGDQCEFKAAVVLSNPWNLEIGNRALRRTWIGLNIYSRAMGTSLKELFFRHIDKLSQNPAFDVEAIRKLKYLHEFDALVQCPSWGYPTAAAYYRDAASTDSLLNIRIPFLSINAEDDPIVSSEALPYEEVQETPYGVLCATELGGHLSWFEVGGGRWFATAGANFLKKMVHDVDLNALPKPQESTPSNVMNGHIKGPDGAALKPVFTSTRRKWHVPGSANLD